MALGLDRVKAKRKVGGSENAQWKRARTGVWQRSDKRSGSWYGRTTIRKPGTIDSASALPTGRKHDSSFLRPYEHAGRRFLDPTTCHRAVSCRYFLGNEISDDGASLSFVSRGKHESIRAMLSIFQSPHGSMNEIEWR